jgi:hypothetical protein
MRFVSEENIGDQVMISKNEAVYVDELMKGLMWIYWLILIEL